MYQPYPPPPPPPPTVRPPRWGRFIAWTAGAAVAAFAIGGGVAVLMDDDSSSSANPAVCKTALTAAYREAMAAGPDAPTAAAPPSCVGLDEAVLERITGEVIAEYLESPEAARDLERALESATP